MSDFHDGERFGVTRNPLDYSVIDRLDDHKIRSRHRSRVAAHRQAERLNRQHRAERACAQTTCGTSEVHDDS